MPTTPDLPVFDVRMVEIIWRPARQLPDGTVEPNLVELTALDQNTLPVMMPDEAKARLLDAFHASTQPGAQAAVRAVGMFQSLLSHLLERLESVEMPTHPDGEPLVDENWVAGARSLMPPPR